MGSHLCPDPLHGLGVCGEACRQIATHASFRLDCVGQRHEPLRDSTSFVHELRTVLGGEQRRLSHNQNSGSHRDRHLLDPRADGTILEVALMHAQHKASRSTEQPRERRGSSIAPGGQLAEFGWREEALHRLVQALIDGEVYAHKKIRGGKLPHRVMHGQGGSASTDEDDTCCTACTERKTARRRVSLWDLRLGTETSINALKEATKGPKAVRQPECSSGHPTSSERSEFHH